MVGRRRRRFETATRHSFTVAPPSSLPPPHKSLLLLFPKASHVIPLWRTDTTKERLRQQLLLPPSKVSQPDVVGVAPSPPPQPTPPPPPPPPSSFLPRYSFGFVRWAPLVCMYEGERKGGGGGCCRPFGNRYGGRPKKLREATPAHATNPNKRGRGENERSVRGGKGWGPLPKRHASWAVPPPPQRIIFIPFFPFPPPPRLPPPLSILILLLLLLPIYVGRYSNCMCCCLATTSNKGSDVSSEGDSRIRLNSSLSENLLPCCSGRGTKCRLRKGPSPFLL